MVSDVEWGQTLALTKELDHKLRNLRMIVDELETDIHIMRTEIQHIKVQTRTALSVIGCFVSIAAWVFR